VFQVFHPSRGTPVTRLPKGARAVGRTELATNRGIAPPRRARARDGSQWRCYRCKELFSAYATVERHVDREHGGGRIECVIDRAIDATDRGRARDVNGNPADTPQESRSPSAAEGLGNGG
jgi:hypothetical protein